MRIASMRDHPRPVLPRHNYGLRFGKLLSRTREFLRYKHYQGKQVTVRVYQKLAPATLGIFGLTSFTIGAFQINSIVGFIVAGLSFFALEWRINQ